MQSEKDKFEELVISYLSGVISGKDSIILLELLNSDEKYRNQFHELAKTRAISYIPAIEKDKKINYQKLQQQIHSAKRKKMPDYWKQLRNLAAILLISVATGIGAYILYGKFVESQQLNMVSQTIVPFGSQTKVVLPDGTTVWLNSGSELTYDNTFGKDVRKVTFNGEGYFEVAKNEDVPFLVSTGEVEIKVLGTVFNVNSYVNETTVKVDLLEGKVDVTSVSANEKENHTLLPNEMLVYDKKTRKITSGKSDAAKSAQWKSGKLSFDNVSMEKLLRNLERKYDVRFVVESKKIKSEIFSGSIDLQQPLNEILEYIDVDKKFERIYEGRTVRIRDKQTH